MGRLEASESEERPSVYLERRLNRINLFLQRERAEIFDSGEGDAIVSELPFERDSNQFDHSSTQVVYRTNDVDLALLD